MAAKKGTLASARKAAKRGRRAVHKAAAYRRKHLKIARFPGRLKF